MNIQNQNNKINNSKIIKYREKRYFNIIGFVFIFVFIYLVVQIYRFMTTESISIYELEEKGVYSVSSVYKSIITRDETIFYTKKESTINYSVKEGRKVKADSAVYTTEDASFFTDALISQYSTDILSETNLTILKTKLVKAAQKDISSQFSQIYSDKDEMQVTVFDSFLLTALDTLGELASDGKHCVTTDTSGYVTFRTDTYDKLVPQDVTKACFDLNNYETTIYSTAETRPKGAFAYKLIPNDRMSLTFQISEEDAARHRNQDRLEIELLSEGLKVTGDFSVFTGSDGTLLATVTVDKYGSSFLTDRFTDIKIVEDSVTGYKIPKSAVLTKDFLVIPADYVIDANAKGAGVLKETVNADGSDSTTFVNISIYAKKGDTYYISSPQLTSGDYIFYGTKIGNDDQNSRDNAVDGINYTADLTKRCLVSLSAPLTGVYNINKGYCIFRQIDILSETNDDNYYIIDTETSYGLAPYDRIILNADLVTENQIIY